MKMEEREKSGRGWRESIPKLRNIKKTLITLQPLHADYRDSTERHIHK